jgi:CDP-diacylglycerol--glycerol-3-phosphate 3-phosphatidyltransferase
MNIPNSLSILRLLTVPVLAAAAWHGQGELFLAVFAFGLLTDGLDGFIARRFNQATELGARLDSWADIAIYVTVVASAGRLWPEILWAERYYFAIVAACVVIPPAAGLVKFGVIPSYHTWLVKAAVGLTALSVIALFLGGPAWPFRLSAGLVLLAAAEQLLITATLDAPVSNVRSWWDVIKKNSEFRSRESE